MKHGSVPSQRDHNGDAMVNFIKVLTASGHKYVRTSDIVMIEVDNNSATDWYVKIVLTGSLGSYAVIDDIDNEAHAHNLAYKLAHSLTLTDAEVYK